ncbi:MAG: hypothetical protein ABJA98_21745 [Acidobacteriota bacterium]
MRQLIASGDHKAALEQAKDLHKVSGTLASEALLVDAYAERIRALLRRNLTIEAQSLLDMVRQRYPASRVRLAELTPRVEAKPLSLDDLVRPLNDPDLAAEQRTAIDRRLRQEVWDLKALAHCDALALDHELRKAAAALERALVAVTSGPVTDDALALPEVSRRSPLAPWKLLARAIASFYRRDDDACRRYLEAIDSESAPTRLVPAIKAMLADDAHAPLTPAAAALGARITSASTLRRALEALDEAFASASKNRILKAIRPAVDQCQQVSPEQLDSLRQHVSVRCALAVIDSQRVVGPLGGPSRHDATFLRLFARGLEETRNPDQVVLACRLWEDFRHAAVREGWFADNGPEAAALALHMADLLNQLPNDLLRDLQWSARAGTNEGGDKLTYLFQEELYRRACVLDPHPESFSQWMEWAARQPGNGAERVATAWHKIRPRDLDPILRLMNAAEARGALPTALGYLGKAERIDSLHLQVRGARLRLLAGNALRHLQQKKPALATEDLAQLSTLPDAQQGDRPAFLAALRLVSSAARGESERVAALRADVEQLLGSGPAAALLVSAVAAAAKQRAIARLGSVEDESERRSLPSAVARVAALAADMSLKLEIPASWMVEVAKQFPECRQTLDAAHLRRLGELAVWAGMDDLAYAISTAGLERGETTAARFLLLRANATIKSWERHIVCAKAAAVLGREQQDTALVDEAAALVRGFFEFEHVSLTLEQARDVLNQEKAAREPSTKGRPGPTYAALLANTCQCVSCRQARGEADEPFDDLDVDDDEDVDDDDDSGFGIPPGMPPELVEMFAAEIEKAVRRGESPEEFMARLSTLPPRRRRRKRRR